MQQTFEFFKVDPATWKNTSQINTIISCSINNDLNNDLISTASIECEEELGECYVRVYLKCVQDGVTYSFPFGTYLAQSPETTFDGRYQKISVDAYSPLIELKDSKPPFGYAALSGDNIMDLAGQLVSEHVRCPVVKVTGCETTLNSNFVSDFENDTYYSFVHDIIANANYHFSLDELGRILFAPDQKVSALRPVWTFNDGNSSILYPDISRSRDLYGIPNVVEVLCSYGSGYKFYRAENHESNSPVSIENRGREIIHRVNNPPTLVSPSDAEIKHYAEKLLESLTKEESTITYKHGYCGTSIGRAVRLNYERAGIKNVIAMVVSQTIECKPGCMVTEKAVYTTKMWG